MFRVQNGDRYSTPSFCSAFQHRSRVRPSILLCFEGVRLRQQQWQEPRWRGSWMPLRFLPRRVNIHGNNGLSVFWKRSADVAFGFVLVIFHCNCSCLFQPERDKVGMALWSHVCVVAGVQAPPPWLADPLSGLSPLSRLLTPLSCDSDHVTVWGARPLRRVYLFLRAKDSFGRRDAKHKSEVGDIFCSN